MDMTEAQVWAFLITAGTTAIVTVVTAVGVLRVKTQGQVIEKKVDVVHDATNSRLSRIDGQLAAALAEISTLRAVAAKVEETRIVLADVTAAAAMAPAHPLQVVDEPIPVEIVATTPVPVIVRPDIPLKRG